MAEINPEDLEGTRKTVRSQTRKVTLILLGVVFIVLMVLLIPNWKSITGLFKGFIGETPEGVVEIAPIAPVEVAGIAPEEEPEEEPEVEPEEEPEFIKITDVGADPDGFNPLIHESKLTYKISKDAVIEIKILDEKGLTVITLINNEELDQGSHFVWWNGTDKTEEGGTIVLPGTYTYKIIAMDPDTEEVQDIKTGEIEAEYEIAEVDFEDVTPQAAPAIAPAIVAAIVAAPTTQDTTQAAATMALQETQTGVTADTGPEALIYLLFPVAGYFASRIRPRLRH